VQVFLFASPREQKELHRVFWPLNCFDECAQLDGRYLSLTPTAGPVSVDLGLQLPLGDDTLWEGTELDAAHDFDGAVIHKIQLTGDTHFDLTLHCCDTDKFD
jgi:hypothetical protein